MFMPASSGASISVASIQARNTRNWERGSHKNIQTIKPWPQWMKMQPFFHSWYTRPCYLRLYFHSCYQFFSTCNIFSCISLMQPNDRKVAGLFDDKLVRHQVRYLGWGFTFLRDTSVLLQLNPAGTKRPISRCKDLVWDVSPSPIAWLEGQNCVLVR